MAAMSPITDGRGHAAEGIAPPVCDGRVLSRVGGASGRLPTTEIAALTSHDSHPRDVYAAAARLFTSTRSEAAPDGSRAWGSGGFGGWFVWGS